MLARKPEAMKSLGRSIGYMFSAWSHEKRIQNVSRNGSEKKKRRRGPDLFGTRQGPDNEALDSTVGMRLFDQLNDNQSFTKTLLREVAVRNWRLYLGVETC
jgi:hypothetical protein